MNATEMEKALKAFDKKLKDPLSMVMGGGAAMLLVYGHKEATADIDAAPLPYRAFGEFQNLVYEVAEELHIPKDWLNSHFTDFTYVLPQDFSLRLRPYFKGKMLQMDALSPEDIIIMKLVAGRNKDRPHLRRLIRLPNINFDLIGNHLLDLKKGGLSKMSEALELLDELRDEIEG